MCRFMQRSRKLKQPNKYLVYIIQRKFRQLQSKQWMRTNKNEDEHEEDICECVYVYWIKQKRKQKIIITETTYHQFTSGSNRKKEEKKKFAKQFLRFLHNKPITEKYLTIVAGNWWEREKKKHTHQTL